MISDKQAPKVVHCRKEPYDVYIGRPSLWGNPFTFLNRGQATYFVASREIAVRSYSQWIQTQPALMEALPTLAGKVLGCWCAPMPCHGDVLLEMANRPEVGRMVAALHGKEIVHAVFIGIRGSYFCPTDEIGDLRYELMIHPSQPTIWVRPNAVIDKLPGAGVLMTRKLKGEK